jgi:thiamine biosynthesis lipoprotein
LRTLRGTLANEVERIESTLSHWRRDSATSRFNANLSTDLQSVPEELGRLVSFSGRLSAATSGAYDITVAPLVDAWGFGPGKKMGRSPSEEEISEVLSRVGWEKVVISQRVDGLQKTHPRIELDLGSILQGYAVDRLHELLTGAGIREFLVEVGGELRASGSWKIAIENPEDASSALCVMELRDAALATSGAGRTRGGKEELRGHKVCHILSPRTGRPVECDLKQLSVRAATCLEADGWATALFASGSSAARRIAQREGLSLWMLESNRAFEEP